MINNKLTVGITQGDGNGIGYEVIIKALADARILDSFTPVIYGSSKIFGFYRKLIHNLEQLDTYVINSASEVKPKKINILNCLPDNVYVEPGQPSPESAKCAITALDKAVEDLKRGDIDVLVTGPINKRAMTNAGFGFTGHTEYLKQAFGVSDVAMFMISSQLKIAVVTGHIPLKDVVSSITSEKILTKLRLMNASLKRDFGITKPKIAVLGLNPHCGDDGLLGDEEQTIIAPAVKAANDEGIMAFGYHDQGLAPFKALDFEDGVNFTAGLPVVRTSPDHGTAYGMAGRDEADPMSMMSSIYAAIDIFKHRMAYDRLEAGKMHERSIDNGRPERPGRQQIE